MGSAPACGMLSGETVALANALAHNPAQNSKSRPVRLRQPFETFQLALDRSKFQDIASEYALSRFALLAVCHGQQLFNRIAPGAANASMATSSALRARIVDNAHVKPAEKVLSRCLPPRLASRFESPEPRVND